MLRIITQRAEAQAELRRIGDRYRDSDVMHFEAAVRELLASVRRQGDRALLDYTATTTRVTLDSDELRVTGSELDAAYQQVNKDLLDAISLASSQIEAFHRQRVPSSWVQFQEEDIVLGKRYQPVERAGIYVPGGGAANPCRVLMNAIPAKVAGVRQTILSTPPGPDKKINPAVLVAAQFAGIQEVYRVPGAAAIGAFAYGTETIPPVDVIVGGDNIYVTLAKKLVAGTVGIDCLTGGSELLIVADRHAVPKHVATDLLAQAERDPMASAILLTPDYTLATLVADEVDWQLRNHSRQLLTEKAIAHYGLVVVVESLASAADLSNAFAPQYLMLQVADPWSLLAEIRHAGAIFLGYSSPIALGDYLAGPNHNLPNLGAARYASALGVETFMKHSSIIHYSPGALNKVAEAIELLAQAEGSQTQADSVRLRTEGQGDS
ncbi:MAG: histidinol dehydrogenase [Hormoscilla sp.]